MGVIRKQSISGTIYSYIGVALGFVVTAILFPRVLNTEEVGLLRVIVSYAVMFAQFASLGFTAVTIKLFPHFRNEKKKHHGFLGLALLVSLTGFVLVAAIYLLFRPTIIDQAQEKSELFISYFYWVVPLIFFTLLFNVFDTYYRVLYNAVKGIFVKEVIQRFGILVVILLYYFNLIDFHTTVLLYILALTSPSLILFVSLINSRQLFLKPDFTFISKDLRKEMLSVGFFGIIASYSGVLVLNIDILMVNGMLGLSAAGIYAVTFYFGTLILIPMRTMGKIGSVIIADAWKQNDTNVIDNIYKKSSISLSVIGLLLFIGIWGNINNVFLIIGDDYLPGKMVIFYIGVANLIDISLGMSSHIILNSKYYKFLSYFLAIFAAMLILFNWLLIPVYGIVGAAMASLLAKLFFNLIKYLFIYRKFGLQPFTMKFLLLIVIAGVAYWISTFIPQMSNYIIDIIVRSAVITILFGLPVYGFKISDEINEKADEILVKLKIRK